MHGTSARVTDQSSCGVKQVFDRDQAVLTQSATGGHQVDNRFRHSSDGTQLNRAIEVNQLNGKVEGIEIFPGAVGEFAGDAAVGRQIRSPGVTTALLNRHGHPATAKAQVHQLGDGELMLLEYVVTHHPQLSLAVGHVSGHITVANQQGPGAPARVGTINWRLFLSKTAEKSRPAAAKRATESLSRAPLANATVIMGPALTG